MNKDKAIQQINKMLGDKHIHLTDIISQVVQDVNVISDIEQAKLSGKITDHVPMTKERYVWYRNEIERLRNLDMEITDKVRATYSIDNCCDNEDMLITTSIEEEIIELKEFLKTATDKEDIEQAKLSIEELENSIIYNLK